MRARVELLGRRADHGFPIASEQGQWLRDVALALLDGIDEAAVEGAKQKKPAALGYAPGPLDRTIANVSTLELPRLS